MKLTMMFSVMLVTTMSAYAQSRNRSNLEDLVSVPFVLNPAGPQVRALRNLTSGHPQPCHREVEGPSLDPVETPAKPGTSPYRYDRSLIGEKTGKNRVEIKDADGNGLRFRLKPKELIEGTIVF